MPHLPGFLPFTGLSTCIFFLSDLPNLPPLGDPGRQFPLFSSLCAHTSLELASTLVVLRDSASKILSPARISVLKIRIYIQPSASVLLSVVGHPAASASLGNLLGMQNPRPRLRPTESAAQVGRAEGVSSCCQLPGGSDTCRSRERVPP